MSGTEILLIIIGLVIIAASYVVTEKLGDNKEEVHELETVADYERRKQLEKGMESRFAEMSEEAVNHVNAALCKLSNEKIMAVNEYGDMVLDKIDKNHSEVVFLYSMLTDKEKELKELLLKDVSVNQQEVKKKLDAMDVTDHDKEKESLVMESETHLLQTQAKELHKNRPEEVQPMQLSEQHDNIISLLKEGKSVLEVSKELNLGQGEVQLLANLYAGGRK